MPSLPVGVMSWWSEDPRSVTLSPYVMSKLERPFPTGSPEVVDTVLGWRLVNPRMQSSTRRSPSG